MTLLINILILLFFLAIGGSIIWSTLRTGVPPMPSSRKVRNVIAASLENIHEKRIIDLGSGWGTLVTHLALKFPERQIIGYELSFAPWFFSLFIKHIYQLNNLTLYRKNFFKADLSGAVLLCYLLPSSMSVLEKKLQQDKKTASLLISNTFALPSCKIQKQIRIQDIYKSPVYIYDIAQLTTANRIQQKIWV
jgi:hypothetical protein